MNAASGVPGTLPPWRTALTAALQRGRTKHETRYLQLATLGLDGRARNRSVVFRGFGPASEVLILTDARSTKIAELAREPQAEICWYLPVTREQFRLEVTVGCHGADAADGWAALRQQLWEARGARGQADWLGAVPDAPVALAVPEFVLLACTVSAVDHLELRPTPQEHRRYLRSVAGWTISTV